MVETFGGDYRVMRVCFANADPLQAFVDLHDKVSVRKFFDFLELLDARDTIQEDMGAKARRKAEQDAQEQQRKAGKSG